MRGGQTWKHCKEQSTQKQSADSAGASGCLLHWQRLEESIWVCFLATRWYQNPAVNSSSGLIWAGKWYSRPICSAQSDLKSITFRVSLMKPRPLLNQHAQRLCQATSQVASYSVHGVASYLACTYALGVQVASYSVHGVASCLACT